MEFVGQGRGFQEASWDKKLFLTRYEVENKLGEASW
jgi:hypothetical protein